MYLVYRSCYCSIFASVTCLSISDNADPSETISWRKCYWHFNIHFAIGRHWEPHVFWVGINCIMCICIRSKKILIPYSILHHIVWYVYSHVKIAAIATECIWIQKDSLCSIWDDTGNVVCQCCCCEKLVSSNQSPSNRYPWHWRCISILVSQYTCTCIVCMYA